MTSHATAATPSEVTEISSRTDRLAEFVVGLTPAKVPEVAYQRAADLVADYLAVSIHGRNLPWSRIIAEYAEADGGRPDSTVIAGSKVSSRMAALANGTIAHGIELDDTHEASLTHPGAVVISAALAIAERENCSGRDFLTAVIAGYEIQTRAAAALTGDLLLRGLHPTAISGVWGSSAAAANLLKFSFDHLQSAWGLAASMASGVMKFTQDPLGTMVKRMHAGLPAHNGVMAAELAARGFRGPQQALDGKHGFVNVFCPQPEPWRLDEKLGQSWAIDQIAVKFYACCKLFHAMIEAIELARDEASWSIGDLAAIEAFGPRVMSEGHMEYRPASVMSAQYSLPYVVATTLLLDPRDPRSFGEDKLQQKDILALADIVTGAVDDKLQAAFPAKYAGGIRLRMKDGRVLERVVFDAFGTPARPVDRAGIEEKFRALTQGIVRPGRQKEILNAAFGLTELESVQSLTRLIGQGLASA